jgi:hypothetical protein
MKIFPDQTSVQNTSLLNKPNFPFLTKNNNKAKANSFELAATALAKLDVSTHVTKIPTFFN